MKYKKWSRLYNFFRSNLDRKQLMSGPNYDSSCPSSFFSPLLTQCQKRRHVQDYEQQQLPERGVCRYNIGQRWIGGWMGVYDVSQSLPPTVGWSNCANISDRSSIFLLLLEGNCFYFDDWCTAVRGLELNGKEKKKGGKVTSCLKVVSEKITYVEW